jgi:hypothetical protein
VGGWKGVEVEGGGGGERTVRRDVIVLSQLDNVTVN